MRGTTSRAVAAVVVVLAASGCTSAPSVTNPPKETVVHNNLTQKQATAKVDEYIGLVATQLPPGSRLASLGTGTVNCHTPDGKERTGQVFVAARHSVEGVELAVYPGMVDHLRRTWTSLGYKIFDDVRGKDGDLIFAVATPADDYHLTIWVYGDNRSTPLLLIESPCAWPDPAPSTSLSGLGGS